MESELLVFDDLPFGLTVIEALMHGLKLLGGHYKGSDKFYGRDKDIDTVSDEEGVRRRDACDNRYKRAGNGAVPESGGHYI